MSKKSVRAQFADDPVALGAAFGVVAGALIMTGLTVLIFARDGQVMTPADQKAEANYVTCRAEFAGRPESANRRPQPSRPGLAQQ